jgi:hypothetical protein
MATVIDALLVTLGLDASGYKSGTDEVAKQQAKLEKLLKKDAKERTELDKKAERAQKLRAEAFEKQGKKAAETFGKIREHALGLIAVLAGGVGMAEFAKATIDQSANLGRLSHNLGMSIKDLQAWGYAAKAVGGSAQGAQNLLGAMTESVQNFRKNGIESPQMAAMLKYGIAVHRTGVGQLMAVSKYLSSLYKTDPALAMTRASEMGIDENQFNLLKRYNRLQKLLAEGRKIAPFSRGDAEQAEAMQKWWAGFTTQIKKVATSVFYAFLPAIKQLQAQMSVWASWLIAHRAQIVEWVETFAEDVVKLAQGINHVVQEFGGWKVVLAALVGLKLASMASGVVRLASAFAGLAGALARITGLSGAANVIKSAVAAGSGAAVSSVAAGALALAYSQKLNQGENKALGEAEKRSAVMAYLQSQGLSKADAAAFAGNFKVESNFDPSAVGDNGQAYGIAQWHPDRQALFQKVMGRPIQGSSVQQQLQFAIWEFKNRYPGAWAKFQAAKTPYEKAAIMTQYYEAPANLQANIVKRGGLAQEYYNDPTVRMQGAAPVAKHIGAQSSAPAMRASVTHNISTNEAHVGQVVINTSSTDPYQHGRLFANAVRRYLVGDPLNSAYL